MTLNIHKPLTQAQVTARVLESVRQIEREAEQIANDYMQGELEIVREVLEERPAMISIVSKVISRYHGEMAAQAFCDVI